jgi:hypothetical protein
MCRLSICVNGWTVADLQNYMNSAILVCRERGFTIQAIGLPGPEMRTISDREPDVLGLMGSYQGFRLYVQDDYPVGAELEFVFAC